MRTPFLLALLALALAGCTTQDPAADTTTPTAGTPPQIIREDFRSFTLGPDQDIEWKYLLSEGASMTYTWSAGRPVRFDFHGDRDDGTDDFVSHKKGNLATDQGDFSAPFTGRHGWYFHNPNGQTVTIALEVEGDFDIVGRTGGNAP